MRSEILAGDMGSLLAGWKRLGGISAYHRNLSNTSPLLPVSLMAANDCLGNSREMMDARAWPRLPIAEST